MFVGDFVRGVPSRLFVPVDHDDIGADVGHRVGDLPTDTPVAARDDGCLSIESESIEDGHVHPLVLGNQ